EDGAGGRIAAGHCLVSRPPPEPADDPPGDAVLVRQTGARAGAVSFRSAAGPDRQPERNGYHNLSAFWSDETPAAGPVRATTLEDARARKEFRDDDALELPLPPWAEPRPLARLFAGDEKTAFAVNLKSARLRLPHNPQAGTLGVQRNVWGETSAKLPPLAGPAEAATARTRIVDPSAESDSAQGVYPSLAHALPDLRPGDVVLLKKNGLLELEPAVLAKADLRLTLRPFPNYRPVLAPAAAAADADP